MSNKMRLEKETTARRMEAERLAVKAREKESMDKQQNALRRQKEFREKTQIWNEQILPRWHELFQSGEGNAGFGWPGLLGSGRSAKVRDLCHKGIPPNIRGKVWPLMINNDLKINGEIFEHLNRKVIQIYGVNLTANKPLHPEDQKNHSICPVYRDSFLGLFDEGHPLYPRDNSPANKDAMKFARDTSSIGKDVGGGKPTKGQFRLNHNLLNNPNKLEPEQRDRTVSVMKRAQSLSSLVSLVTSEKDASFSVRLTPKSNPVDAQEDGPESTSERLSPKENNSLVQHPKPFVDITEEPWFQNERNGSLDQSAFEYVQKQLFEGTEAAAERTKSTEYTYGSGNNSGKAPFFGNLETVEEESPSRQVSTADHPALSPTRLITSQTTLLPSRSPEGSPKRSGTTSAAPDSPSQLLRKAQLSAQQPHPVTATPTKGSSAPVLKSTSPNQSSLFLKAALTNSAVKSVSPSAHTATATSAAKSTSPGSATIESYPKRQMKMRESTLLSAKTDASFFSTSSDESEADSDDDIIPHIIPLDMRTSSGSNEAEADNNGDNNCDSTENPQPNSVGIGDDHRTSTPVKLDSSRPNSRNFTPSRQSPLPFHNNNNNNNNNNNHTHSVDTSFTLDQDASQGEHSAYHSAYNSHTHSSSASPHGTPPPRMKHTEEYLASAGLLHSDDVPSKPQLAREGSGRLRLMFPHNPNAATNSPSASRAHSYNSRSYSRQSIEDILHHAMSDRDTEGTGFAPSSSRFSFQSTSTSARLGSMDGMAVLLSDEPIHIQDEQYFPQPVATAQDSQKDGAADHTGVDGEAEGSGAVESGIVGSSSGGGGTEDNAEEIGALSPSQPNTANNLSNDATERLINSMSLIEWDLPRTYPTLGFFHDGGPMHTGLERVLMCYVCYRPDVGYVQGMSYLVATLLLYMDEFEAFKCMANLLGRKMNMDFYCLQKEAIDSYVHCFNFFFEKMLPLLYEHFRSEGVTSEMFLLDWMLSIFTKTLPLEVAAHIWDVYLFEGEMYLMCVALGILKLYAARLSTLSMERVSPFLLHLPEDIKPEELFNCISQIKLSRKRYDRIRLKMAIKCYGSLEGYQKSFTFPNPDFEGSFSPTSPLSSNGSAGMLTPPSVHVISSSSKDNKNSDNKQSAAVASTDFWGRRRTFRRSIFDTLTGKWGNNNNNNNNGKAITNSSSNKSVQRANTTYSGGVAPSPVATSRRASTGTAASPLK